MYNLKELEYRCRLYRQATVSLAVAFMIVVAVLVVLAIRGPQRYLVVLDSFGAARAVEPLAGLHQVDKRFMVAELRRLVTDVRSVSRDPSLDQLRLAGGLELLSANVRRDVLRDLSASKRPRQRDVDVLAIHELEVKGRYLVRWQETSYEGVADGGKEELWEAYVTTRFVSELDEEEILRNPLGMMITHLSWTRLGINDKGKTS